MTDVKIRPPNEALPTRVDIRHVCLALITELPAARPKIWNATVSPTVKGLLRIA